MAGVLAVVVVVGGLAWSATSGRPAAAQRPSIFGGSLVLEDTRPLTVINVATAQITVRLEGVNAQVGAANDGDVQPVAVSGGTVLVNRISGSFNFLEADDYVTDPNGPGVGLGPLAGSTAAKGFASGPDAYIVRSGLSSTVSLVGQQTVAEAAKAQGSPGAAKAITAAPAAAVSPIGFSSLGAPVSLAPGSVAVSGPDLWVLEGAGTGCSLVRLHPDPTSSQGLVPSTRARATAPCSRDAVESDGPSVGLATPGQIEVIPAGGPVHKVATPFTAAATRLLPVTGAVGRLWFLADGAAGWQLLGVDPLGHVQGPYRLTGLGPRAEPVVPALSRGFLYTLDQAQIGQPTLWTIDTANGHMAPLQGTPAYPLLSRSEKDSFDGAQIVAIGPRVVINNPQSLEAVVVFTDSSRLPVVVDKSQAVAVSTTGPADLTAKTPTTKPGSKPTKGQPAASEKSPLPVVQPVSQQVTCANTTQKPYAPQITGVTPSSGSALIQWSYQLLDQTDCEPSSWSVQVKALTGGHQPATPVQVVNGQNQYLFTGLRPTTTYQVVVTAYINHQSTPSAPTTFTTSARGPDAPLSVQTRADGHGDWVVSWTPCTEADNANCVVPADQWTVTGAACAGSFVGSPPSVQVAGSQDSVTINAAALQMLGDSVSFTVQGRLASGLTGNPTADHACTEAYQKPDPSAIAVSGQGTAAPDGTITATITVTAQAGSSTAFGVPADQAEFVYTVAGGAAARTVGPVARTSEVLTGLPPGVSLTPSVEVYPAGHPDAAVTVTGKAFQQTLPWPDLSATSAVGKLDAKDPNQGSVTVTFPPNLPAGPLSATAPIAANSPGAGPQIQCGGTGGAVLPYPVQSVSPGRQLVIPMADLVDEGGSCTVSLSLSDGADPNPYGGPSPDMTIPFTIGSQPDYSFQYSIPCGKYECGPLGKHYTVDVDALNPPFQFQGGGDWSVIVRDTAFPQAVDPCYTNQGLATPPSFPYSFQLPGKCLFSGSVTVTVDATYLGQSNVYQATATNTPGPPATTTTTSTTSTTSTTTTTTTTSSSSTTAAGASPARANPVAKEAVGWSFAAVAAVWPVRVWRRSRNRRKSRKAAR